MTLADMESRLQFEIVWSINVVHIESNNCCIVSNIARG